MKKIYLLTFLVMNLLSGICEATAQEKCVNAPATAAIVNNDIPSAKIEAIARAKWSAIEQVVGTEIKAHSFVQNFTLIEDVIKTKAGGVVKSYKIMKEENGFDTFKVMIYACVEPLRAKEIVSNLALNNSVAVFITARKPGYRGAHFEETNVFSEALIEKLTEQNYNVIDVASKNTKAAKEIENEMKSGSTIAVRSMLYKYLSNIMIIGKVDYSISTRKGSEIGYGLSMPFNSVTSRLTYRIIAKNNKTGGIEILTAGTAQAKGLANTAADAAEEAMKELVENVTPVIMDKLSQYIKGNTKKISIKVNGVNDLDKTLEIKDMLQSIVWVSGVEEKQMGNFIVDYPENTLYLANSIKQKGLFKIINFSQYSLTLAYE